MGGGILVPNKCQGGAIYILVSTKCQDGAIREITIWCQYLSGCVLVRFALPMKNHLRGKNVFPGVC